MALREALRMLRSEVGLTQVELASAVYVSFSTVNRWENKDMRPNKMQSKALIDLAKQHHVSTACLDGLTKCLLASRADDKEDRERLRLASDQIKMEQRDLLTAEQFRKTMDRIDMALVGQRFYNRNPATCDIFYENNFFINSLGYPVDEYMVRIRENPFFAVAPEYRKEFFEKLGALLRHQIDLNDFTVVVQAVRKDGSTLWLEVKAASLTEYSFGQELFTFCRDVTRRVEAERNYNEEVLLRNVSMQVMFANVYCDLTKNVITRHYNLAASLGREYAGETFDELARLIANAAPDSEEKETFLRTFNREALLAAYARGDVYGNVILYNSIARRWFRNEYVVLRNPVNGSVHALIYVFDIQKQVLSESMLNILFDTFFDYVGLIDVDAETVEPYYVSDKVFREKTHDSHFYPSICAEKLKQYGYPETAEQEGLAIDLHTVRARLEKANFYSAVLHLKGYDGQPLLKKVTYTYLDQNRNTIIMAQSDLNQLTHFLREHKARFTKQT